jgi:hypothetical protein
MLAVSDICLWRGIRPNERLLQPWAKKRLPSTVCPWRHYSSGEATEPQGKLAVPYLQEDRTMLQFEDMVQIGAIIVSAVIVMSVVILA